MIDWNAPIELDNGTEVARVNFDGQAYLVEVRGPYARNDGDHRRVGRYWYTLDGVWEGGDAERMFVIRNRVVNRPEEMICEDWS